MQLIPLPAFVALLALVSPSLLVLAEPKEAPICLAPESGVKCDSETKKSTQPCPVYLAESAVQPGKLGLFTGIDRSAGVRIVDPDLFVPIIDANKNEWSPWHDVVASADVIPEVLLESYFLTNIFLPGISSMVACSNKYTNLLPEQQERSDSAGVHRAKDPTAGSFTYYHNSGFQISKDLKAGEELVMPCRDEQKIKGSGRKILSLDFLQETALCFVTNLSVGTSTLPGVGRGAFSSRAIKKDEMIASSPVIHFDRSQMEILEQEEYGETHVLPIEREHGIRYSDIVAREQLLLNYCYGQTGSDVLLLPYAPVVNFINHNSEKSNAEVRWSRSKLGDAPYMKSQRPMELFSIPVGNDELLVIDFVATRDIEPGEEIFINYGDEWVEAWEEHVEEWKPDEEDNGYMSAAEFSSRWGEKAIRTEKEQETDPYPDNIMTACYFTPDEDYGEESVQWSTENFGCLRPCDIIERYQEDDETLYSVEMQEIESVAVPEHCGSIPDDGLEVEGVQPIAIKLVDAPYSTDMHLLQAFRHEISLPEDFFPEEWEAADPSPMGNFLGSPLKPGEMDKIRWSENGEVATPWAFRLGLNSHIREVLLDYCNKMGITDILRHVTVEGNSLQPGEETTFKLQGDDWYLQRPDKHWYSNLHWLSPAGNPAHEHYLQALSEAGFDDMLEAIGQHLKMDGLVAFHVTFIAVSQATRGYVHIDVTKTQAKTYNVIIPLILANESAPELDLQAGSERDEDAWIGRYRYEYDVAAMMGDDAYHATSAVDYRLSKEMRLAATVYIADVNHQNVNEIMDQYTQAYPPNDAKLLLSWAGRHWKKDDPSAKLPKPPSDHILMKTDSDATTDK